MKKLITYLLLLISFNSFSQDTIIVDNKIDNIRILKSHLMILPDSLSKLDIKDVSSKLYSDRFISLNNYKIDSSILPLKQAKYCWLKLTIQNNSNYYTFCIEINKSDYQPIILFQQIEQNDFIKRKTGGYFSVTEKDVQLGSLNALKLNINPGKIATFYIKTEIYQSIIDEIYLNNWSIVTYEKTLKKDRTKRMLSSFFLGIMLIMVLYNFILYILIKEKSYFYYVLYIFLFSLFIFKKGDLIYEFFPSVVSFDSTKFVILFNLSFLVAFVLFGRVYLNLKKNFKDWNRIITYFLIIITVLFLGSFVVSKTVPASYLPIIIFILFFLSVIVGLISIIYPSILLLKKGYEPAKYFLIANLFLILGLCLLLVKAFLNIDCDILSYGFEIGVTLQILLFSYGLGVKVNILKKEIIISQKKIINQLEINSNLQKKVNRELEQKVIERTAEIVTQKEEIETQRDNIEEKNEELNQLVEEISTQRDDITRKKETIEKIHYEVSQSIDYAQRIQTSILSDVNILIDNISDHFVLFKPKDIVSGDFYWWENLENHTIITAADCTGHGVPGAFMSMLGVSFLREIVTKEYITHPGVILRKIRKEIIKSLKQKGEMGESKDGMDMALISICHDTNVVQFAGANNPLYIVTDSDINIQTIDAEVKHFNIDNSNKQLIEIKPDKMPIGIYQKMDKFICHEIKVQKGDLVFMFSDGYADQFGGEKGKKFMYKPFKRILLENADKTMTEQKKILNETFEKWKGKNEQIDDVLIIGIKI